MSYKSLAFRSKKQWDNWTWHKKHPNTSFLREFGLPEYEIERKRMIGRKEVRELKKGCARAIRVNDKKESRAQINEYLNESGSN